MPRLRNRENGVVVHVSEDKAERMDREWEPADGGSASDSSTKSARRRKSKTAPTNDGE